MPRIPTYTSQEDLTGGAPNVAMPMQSLDLLSAPGRALERMGAAGSRVASVLSDRAVAMQAEDEANLLLQASVDFSDRWRAYITEEASKTGSDTRGNVERAKQWIAENEGEFIARAQSRASQHKMRQRLYALTNQDLDGLARLQAIERRKTSLGTLDAATESLRKDAYLQPDRLTDLAGQLHQTVSQYNARGTLDEDTAVEVARKEEQLLYGAALDGMIDRDPFTARDQLQKLAPYLSDKQLNAYNDRIETRQRTVLARQEHDEAVRERASRELRDGVEAAAWSKLGKNKLTPDELESLRERRLIDSRAYNALRRGLQTGEGLDDPAVKLDLEDKVLSGAAGREDILEKVGRGIGHQTAAELLRKALEVGKSTDVTKQPDYKEAAEYIDAQIRTKGMMEALDPTDQARRSMAKREFDQRARNPEEAKQGLWKIADDIVERYRPAQLSPKALPTPRYFTGPKNNIDGAVYDPSNVDDAERRTIEGFKAGELSPDAFARELDNLQRIRQLLQKNPAAPQKPQDNKNIKDRLR